MLCFFGQKKDARNKEDKNNKIRTALRFCLISGITYNPDPEQKNRKRNGVGEKQPGWNTDLEPKPGLPPRRTKPC